MNKEISDRLDHIENLLKERDIQYPIKERIENGSYLFKRCFNCDEPLDHISNGELLSEEHRKQSQTFSCINPKCEIQQVTISNFVGEI